MTEMTDAALDTIGDDVEDDHSPCERVAVVESSGAWWAVYRGTEPAHAERFETSAEAEERAEEWWAAATGADR